MGVFWIFTRARGSRLLSLEGKKQGEQVDVNERRGFNECWPGESLREDGAAWGIWLGCGRSHHQETWYHVCSELLQRLLPALCLRSTFSASGPAM